MTPTPTLSAKERVLAFVRAANPATMELKDGCKILVPSRCCANHAFDETLPENDMSLCTVMMYDSGGRLDTADGTDYEGPTITVWCDDWGIARSWGEHGWDDEDCELPKYQILGSDMGLQELLIALNANQQITIKLHNDGQGILIMLWEGNLVKHCAVFLLSQNLHNQPEFFYGSLLPLLP